MRKKNCWCLVVFFILSLLSCQRTRLFTEKVEKKIEITPAMQLELLNNNGNVEMKVWEKSFILMTAMKRTMINRKELKKVSVKELIIQNKLVIETETIDKNNTVTVDYLLLVPSTMLVTFIKTGNGNIKVKKTKGDLSAYTINGNIELDTIDGWIVSETNNGSVKVVGSTGIKKIQTINGSIDVDVANLPQEGTRIISSNASIQIKILHSMGFMLDLSTTNGLIEVQGLGEKMMRVENSNYRAKIFEGGKTLFVKTDNGDIKVRK